MQIYLAVTPAEAQEAARFRCSLAHVAYCIGPESTLLRQNLLLQTRDHGIAQLGRTTQVAVARRTLLFALGLVELSLELLHVVDGVLLVEPAGLLHVEFFLDLGDFLAQSFQALLGGVVGLLHERLLLDLQLGELTRGGVDLDRHAVELHA